MSTQAVRADLNIDFWFPPPTYTRFLISHSSRPHLYSAKRNILNLFPGFAALITTSRYFTSFSLDGVDAQGLMEVCKAWGLDVPIAALISLTKEN